MDEVEFLIELLQIYSPSRREEKLASHLVTRMEELGFDAHVDEVGNVIGELRGANCNSQLVFLGHIDTCLLYTSPSPRDRTRSRMPSSA